MICMLLRKAESLMGCFMDNTAEEVSSSRELQPATRLVTKSLLFVISAPSGSGKSSVIKALLKADSKLKKSISITTRKPRSTEQDGVDYYFKTMQEFEQMKTGGKLLEHVQIYGNAYGTPL